MMERQDSLFLADLTWLEAEERLRERPVGLLPIGATEAHGPHLPLNTDVIIALATAERAAQRLSTAGVPALILPPLSYTISFVGLGFSGTIPVAPTAFEHYLTSLLLHAAQLGVRAIICCNAHLEPAHVECVTRSCTVAEVASGVATRCPDHRQAELATRLSEEFRRGARHAGAYETSIVLAAREDAVRGARLHGLPPVWIDLPAKLGAGARTFKEAGADLGYFGDPAGASREEGERMLDALATIICDAYYAVVQPSS
jgi:creatinine amidohydrolase